MIYKILHKFSEEEFTSFLDLTSAGSNSRKIASMIRKRNGEIEKDEIFKRIFKKKRVVENDHMLRNELSILKRKLENFILGNTSTDISQSVGYYKPYVMMQWCLKRGMLEQAENYLNKAILLAKKNEAWQGLLKLNRYKLQITQYSKSDYHQKLEDMRQLAEVHEEYLKNFTADEIRYVDFIKAGRYKLAVNLRKVEKTPIFANTFSVNVENSRSKMARYYHLKSQAYICQGQQAIDCLQLALKILDDPLEFFTVEEERLTCMSAIAMEYAMLGDLDRSAVMFDRVISNAYFKNFGTRNAVLFNFSTTLLKQGEYKKALQLLEVLEQEDIEPIVKERIYTMKCNCYIFMEDPKGLKRILPKNLRSYDLSVRAYYRFLFLIYYLIKDDQEQAERELENIQQMKNFGETDYLPLIKVYDRYINAFNALLYKENDQTKKMDLLKVEIDHFMHYHKDISQLLPGMWIISKTVQLLKLPNLKNTL